MRRRCDPPLIEPAYSESDDARLCPVGLQMTYRWPTDCEFNDQSLTAAIDPSRRPLLTRRAGRGEDFPRDRFHLHGRRSHARELHAVGEGHIVAVDDGERHRPDLGRDHLGRIERHGIERRAGRPVQVTGVDAGRRS